MAGKRDFVIQFAGLSEGVHEFEMPVGNTFFEDREFSEVKKGSFDVGITLTKHTRMLVLDFVLSGEAEVICDRCAEPFFMPLDTEAQLIVKLSDRFEEESEDVILIPATESELDVSHFIFEYIVTALPISRIHPEGECDPETISKLEELRVANEKQDSKNIDPRWDKLKDLK